MALPRIENWFVHLHDYLAGCRATPFAWGSFDCGLFAAGAIEAMTGIDVGAAFREENYSDALSAARAIKAVTGTGTSIEDGVEWIAAQYALLKLPSALFAQRGDLVVFEGTEGPAAGIVSLSGTVALFASPAGLSKIPLQDCLDAWRIA